MLTLRKHFSADNLTQNQKKNIIYIMQIGIFTANFYTQSPYTAAAAALNANFQAAGNSQMQGHGIQGPGIPGIIVDISPETWAAYILDRDQNTQKASETLGAGPCKTCESRRYVDQSNDPSVSFQTPTSISPGQSASMVMSHEQEHVANEQARAEREGSRIVNQSVTLTSAICPECKRMYISGGTTRTTTVSDNSGENNSAPESTESV